MRHGFVMFCWVGRSRLAEADVVSDTDVVEMEECGPEEENSSVPAESDAEGPARSAECSLMSIIYSLCRIVKENDACVYIYIYNV